MRSLELESELTAVLFVMTKLSTRFPLLSESLLAATIWWCDSSTAVEL